MQKPPMTTTKTTFLFEGNETRRVGGTDTGTTVLDRLAVESLAIDSAKCWLCVSLVYLPLEAKVVQTYYEMENSAR